MIQNPCYLKRDRTNLTGGRAGEKLDESVKCCLLVAGSSPDVVVGFFNSPNPSSHSMAMGSTH
jgi:hypothetical protein